MSDFRFKPVQPNVNFDDHPVAALSDVDKLLIKADETLHEGRRSAMVIGIAITHIVRHGPSMLSLRYLEGRYRALASQTYLLAAPKRIAPPNAEPRSIRTGKLTNYHLWICVNGAREAENMMMQFNISDAEDNLNRLGETGMLFVKKAH